MRDSLFLVPLLVIAGCGGLAALVLYVDTELAKSSVEAPYLLAATVAGGRSIVTTVAGATITVAAIVFSITALSSQIAANQYSPRAVRGFFEDTFQQLVIGLIVGTFTFCLLILGALSSALVGVAEPSPSLAITVAVVLGIASAIGIVAYIDHSLKRFQVDSVVRRIANETLDAVRNERKGAANRGADTDRTAPTGEHHRVRATRSGWVQRIRASTLARSLPADSTAKVHVRLGEPVSTGDLLLTVWPVPQHPDQVARAAARFIEIGRDRSLDNDPAFGIRQLVDIALKALSPGINDPTTAADVVHHLKVPIREILDGDAPTRIYHGPKGQRVYLAATPSRSDFVHSAFSEIRLASGTQPIVLNALIEVLGDLRTEDDGPVVSARSAAISEEMALTLEAARRSGLPEPDLVRVLGRQMEPDTES